MNKIKTFWLSALALVGLTTPAHAFTFSVAKAENCTVNISQEKESYSQGDAITVTITPNEGSTFDSFELYYECTEDEWWEVNSALAKRHGFFAPRRASAFSFRLESFYFNDEYEDEYMEVTKGKKYTFVMPARNVEIEVIYIADNTTYAITATQKENGTTTVSDDTATAGTDITINATPANGFIVDEVKVYEIESSSSTAFETEMEYTTVNPIQFSFTMPQNPVRVEVSYMSASLTLNNNADNAAAINKYDGKTVSITLADRTLWKDNSWNTLCLPFNLTLAGSILEDATVKTLSSATFSGGTLTLNFTNVSSIEAGKPYIVKWASGTDISDPVFSGVTISKAEPTDIEGDAANFHGIYNPYSTGEDRTMLYMGADNMVYFPNGEMTIGAFRAYFTLNGITAGDLPDEARAFVLNFDGGEATGISLVDADLKSASHESGISNPLQPAWYDMQGRQLSGNPTRAGIYIKDGKFKVIIK